MFETMAFLSTCAFATIFIVLLVVNYKASKEADAKGDADPSQPTA